MENLTVQIKAQTWIKDSMYCPYMNELEPNDDFKGNIDNFIFMLADDLKLSTKEAYIFFISEVKKYTTEISKLIQSNYTFELEKIEIEYTEHPTISEEKRKEYEQALPELTKRFKQVIGIRDIGYKISFHVACPKVADILFEMFPQFQFTSN